MHLPTSLLFLLSLSLTPACDDTSPDAAPETVTDRDITHPEPWPPYVCPFIPGSVWGPCKDGGTCGAKNLFCLQGDLGEVCAPACKSGDCPNLDCGIKGGCSVIGLCLPRCTTDADCASGAVCDPSGFSFGSVCVWPL